MATKWLFIEANDSLMFRDSKPFTAGVNFTARSLFPPHPRTMQGVIRTHILESAGVDFREFATGRGDRKVLTVVGTSETFGTLRLSGPFVGRRDSRKTIERLFRTPLDVLQSKADSAITVVGPSRSPKFITNAPFEDWLPLMQKAGGAGAEAGGWLIEKDFNTYLEGKSFSAVLDDEVVYETETRVGLGLDYSKRRGEIGKFYHAEFVRPVKNSEYTTGLLVEIANDEGLLTDGVLAIGGEGRTARAEVLNYKPPSLIKAQTGHIKIVLLTPAYFKNGWQPADGDWSAWVGAGKLVSMAIGKPQIISGFDLVKQKPRPVRHFLPAGSVYYFENATLTGQAFTQTPDDDLDYAAMGFGAYATTTWDYLD